MGSKRKSGDSIATDISDRIGKRVKVMTASTDFGVIAHHVNY